MQKRPITVNDYVLAIATPVAATVAGYAVESIMPKGNISIVYLAAVLFVAAKTHTTPALLCAVISFVAYNFFFTEPEFSLVMSRKEEILTVILFLLIAAVTGRLTARLKERVEMLKEREKINNLQFQFSEKMSGSISLSDVQAYLVLTLKESICTDVLIFSLDNRNLSIDHGPQSLSEREIEAIKAASYHNNATGKYTDSYSNLGYYYYPVNVNNKMAFVVGMKFNEDLIVVADKIKLSGLVIQQAVLALARIKLSQELEQERMINEQEVLRSALLTSVSHDLKTPLSTMMGATSTLIDLDKSLSTSQKMELLQSILSESQRLELYIQNLLDMTRLGQGELSLSRDWVSLDDILNVAVKRIRKQHESAAIISTVEKDLPLVSVHAALIEQAIFNLLDNAIKFSPVSSSIEVEISRKNEDIIQISIADKGPGITDDNKQKIFDMFETIRNGDRQIAGTGLGLTICKGVINAHGGNIEVFDQSEDTGSVFLLTLPIAGYNSTEHHQ